MVARPTPRLEELPPPPAGKTGWPWTEGSQAFPETMPDGRPWPRITVVTPSFQQADFLEETLRSVILQGYPDLEYMVVDGGSSDGSVEIIERYAPWLSWWVSEPDDGQSDAINKGLGRATGDILAWLNSDDVYYPGTLGTVARHMEESGCDILIGAMDKVKVGPDRTTFVKLSTPYDGEPIHPYPMLRSGHRYRFNFIQPPMFWRRWVWESTGGLDLRYDYMMDMEWCHRALAAGAAVETVGDVFACFTLHAGSKSQEFAYRQRGEQVLMYLRLARRVEFRPFPCLLAALRPAMKHFSLRADGAERSGERSRAARLRLAARLLKGLSGVVPRPAEVASLEPAPLSAGEVIAPKVDS
jgi:glycosyltransferase involved in cell wall biosynthesis